MTDMFKVVRTDNYDRETRSDTVIIERVSSETAYTICEALRQDRYRSVEDWYVVLSQEEAVYVFD